MTKKKTKALLFCEGERYVAAGVIDGEEFQHEFTAPAADCAVSVGKDGVVIGPSPLTDRPNPG